MSKPSSNNEDQYHQFFEDAISTGCVWGLQSESGWALCGSEKYPDATVMPFWSQPELAQAHIADDWSDYQAVPISLEEFMDDWLIGMHDDVLLVGVNWDAALNGDELEPLDVLHVFESDYLSE